MNYLNFNIYSLATAGFWFIGLVLFMFPFREKYKKIGHISIISGMVVLGLFLTLFWIKIHQPALRTVTETIIWASLFISILGYFVFLLWQYKWFLAVCLVISISILIFNYLNQTFLDITYKPVFQYKWFIPHVLAYIIAYVFLSGAFIFTIITIFQSFLSDEIPKFLNHTNTFVNIGFVCITLGLIFGAFWAKDAWGHYWTWDIKESWALLSWLLYLVYIHLRNYQPVKYRINLWILIVAFAALLICWVGIDLLPVNTNSMHNFKN